MKTWDSSSKLLHVVVDTPKGSPIKFKYDVANRAYTIAHVLPPGMAFPFDFGSVPQTLADDGDPLDAMILLEAKQTQKGRTMRNDRLIGVAEESRAYREIRRLNDVPDHLLRSIEHFFVAYNEERGRRFRVTGRFGATRARRLVRAGGRRFRESTRNS